MRQHAGGTPALPGGAAAPPRQFQNSTLSKQTGCFQSVMMSMKKSFARVAAVFAAAMICLSGCGKKTETAPEKSAASYPLPDPPLVADCNPGNPGGRLVVATFGDPKTFNPITANEQSSEEIYRHLFATCSALTGRRSRFRRDSPTRGRIRPTARRGRSGCGKICGGATASRSRPTTWCSPAMM